MFDWKKPVYAKIRGKEHVIALTRPYTDGYIVTLFNHEWRVDERGFAKNPIYPDVYNKEATLDTTKPMRFSKSGSLAYLVGTSVANDALFFSTTSKEPLDFVRVIYPTNRQGEGEAPVENFDPDEYFLAVWQSQSGFSANVFPVPPDHLVDAGGSGYCGYTSFRFSDLRKPCS